MLLAYCFRGLLYRFESLCALCMWMSCASVSMWIRLSQQVVRSPFAFTDTVHLEMIFSNLMYTYGTSYNRLYQKLFIQVYL